MALCENTISFCFAGISEMPPYPCLKSINKVPVKIIFFPANNSTFIVAKNLNI